MASYLLFESRFMEPKRFNERSWNTWKAWFELRTTSYWKSRVSLSSSPDGFHSDQNIAVASHDAAIEIYHLIKRSRTGFARSSEIGMRKNNIFVANSVRFLWQPSLCLFSLDHNSSAPW